MGINAASYLSMEKGLIDENTYRDILNVLETFKLPLTVKNIPSEQVVSATLNDKKMDGGIIKFILTDKIGNALISRDVSKADLFKSVEKVINHE